MKFFMFALLLIFNGVSHAQQEWGYTQYLFNLYDINSAYAGNHLGPSFAVRHRSQWIGMDGAPTTQQFSFHTPVAHDKLGIGAKILNESIGARRQQAAKVSGAYKLRFNNRTLSFGIAVGAIKQSADISKINAVDLNDNQLTNFQSTSTTPVVDAAIFYNDNHFYAGIESTRINKNKFYDNYNSVARLYHQFNFTAGYMRKSGQNNMWQISILAKLSEGKNWQGEFNLLYLINNKIWFGSGYRFSTGAHLIACLNLTNHLRLGLSYDMATSQLKKSNDGSAEIFLGYNLHNRSTKSVRFF